MLMLSINMNDKTDVLQGTLDLMVLKTLDTMGARHGYGIAQRLQQVSNDLLRLGQGAIRRSCGPGRGGSRRSGASDNLTARRASTRGRTRRWARDQTGSDGKIMARLLSARETS